MAGIHNLVKAETHFGNIAAYREYRECSCGWQCRAARPELADSQFANHQLHHGFAPVSKEEANEPKNTQELAAQQGEQRKAEQEKKQDSGTSSGQGLGTQSVNGSVADSNGGGIKRIGQ